MRMSQSLLLSVIWVPILVTLVYGQGSNLNQDEGSPCFVRDKDGIDDLSQPQKCNPPFENVVAEKVVSVSPLHMTCGLKSDTKEYCLQTHGIYRECDVCDESDDEKRHPPEYLTDIQEEQNDKTTWWQSVTMRHDVHVKPVNLTVNLGKAYDITYVRLKFHSPRPFSFAIFKKNRRNPALPDPFPDEDWIPWQFYSAACQDEYKVQDQSSIIQNRDTKKLREDVALCTSEFSEATPLTGANVAFSTLDGRPSAYNFEYSPELQSWVSATDIRISLKRLNTFGDEIFGDFKVLQSYYYAITDFTVGGRCQCNGHATHCIESNEQEGIFNTTMLCLCQHNTAGPNCETCMDNSWDRKWDRATARDANECKPCECNGWTSRCRFNEYYYSLTGRGGECLECDGNRDGQHCERCKPNHFFSPLQDEQGRIPCEPCDCDATGSKQLQCAPDGKCECKPGVTGEKCDKCAANYWNFDYTGCDSCECKPEGSIDNNPQCDQETGICACKQNVEGKKCDICKAGHFLIDADNDFGCTPCFCYGHSGDCFDSGGYVKSSITSDFARNDEKWQGYEDGQVDPTLLQFDSTRKYIAVRSEGTGAFFYAPSSYLGNQRFSYNQELSFKLRVNDDSAMESQDDIIIEAGGDKPTRIALSITSQNNSLPSLEMQEYKFRLHENPEFGWNPSMSAIDFMNALSNITAIKIRGSYSSQGIGFLDNVKLASAVRGNSGEQAKWIERCNCPEGYQGQFCQFCIPGYHHENNNGPFDRCVPCKCNGHADTCDVESGKCQCQHNTDGHNCESCARGYFGNALLGTPNDCQKCPCPEGGACREVPGNIVSPVCTECPDGRKGARCEACVDGYFGDPMGQNGPIRPCQKCDCSNNVDPNAIGNCDGLTGECLKCIDNTDGFRCEKCKSGFFGDALALKKPGDPPSCQPCQCFPEGTNQGTNIGQYTFLPLCNGFSGECSCKPFVKGRNCESCQDGYFNIDSGNGCDPCSCDSTGSLNMTCHVFTGQCFCRPGVTGKQCDTCMPKHYGFSDKGCNECDCDPTGSLDLQCDLVTGKCPCRDKVEGRRCDRCMENTQSKDTGGYGEKICEPCDDCYNLVLDAANEHRKHLADLDSLLEKIAENPEPVGEDFKYQLRELQVTVTATLAEARINSRNENGGTLRDRLEDLRGKLEEVVTLVTNSKKQINEAKDKSVDAKAEVDNAKEVIERARDSLKNAKRTLEDEGRDALRLAEERSKKFGAESERMSAIAREARRLAEQQVEDASEIEAIARQAYETAEDAYEMARAAMDQQHATGNQIGVLEIHVQSMGQKLRTVQSLAGQTYRDASEAYNSAIDIYQQAKSLQVPSVDEENIEKQATRVQDEARRIKEEAERLIESNEELLTETQDRRQELEDLMERAEKQQQDLDAQLADMDQHRAKALKAVADGNAVLSDAERTLQTLNDFENTVNANREAARKALEDVSKIENIIEQAATRTTEAREAMQGADNNANLALSVAKDAEQIAIDASGKAGIIKEKAAESRESAAELSSATNSLTDKLRETKDRLAAKEEIAAKDGESAHNALEKANQAQQKAKEAAMKVERAKKELEEIAAILATVQEPEPGLLEELQTRVEAAEQKFKAAELDDHLSEFEVARQRQKEQMRDLQDELEYMKEEATNIQSIRESLPDVCTKNSNRCLENDC